METPRNPRPRVRILIGAATALGPGKVDLFEAIAETGSISAAARAMGMSYRRALSWPKPKRPNWARTWVGGSSGRLRVMAIRGVAARSSSSA